MQTTVETIKQHAESMKNDDKQIVGTASINDKFIQGDVEILCVEEIPPQFQEIQDLQLAPGTTRGSRHIAEGNVTMYESGSDNPLHGPWIRAKESFVVTHPEHADVELPAGCYRVGYQRQHAEELRRVED